MIGVGGMGGGHLDVLLGMPEAQVAAVCDVFESKRLAAARKVEAHYGRMAAGGTFRGCAAYDRYEDLIARADIDAVFIATQDSWHASMAIAAARAGKDIYLEKPLTDTLDAGQAVIDAVRRYARVLQVGQQQRSEGNFRFACELVRNGYIGRLRKILVGVHGGIDSGAVPQPGDPPADLDYDRWLGPAPWKPYSPQRVSSAYWYHCSDYGIGFQAGWGVHHLDIAQWGHGSENSGPVEVEGVGVFPRDGLCDTPITWRTTMRYEDGVELSFTSNDANTQGVRFEGDEGWVFVWRGGIAASPDSLLKVVLKPDELHLEVSEHHHRNFIECVKSRRDPIAAVEVGHRANTLCILSDVAIHLGRKIRWDPERQSFVNDTAAKVMRSRALRSPWGMV